METKKETARLADLELKKALSDHYAKPLSCEAAVDRAVSAMLHLVTTIGHQAKERGMYSICDQLVRSGTSVGANLAEGRGRAS